jgi:hypothetical protein
MTNVVEFIRSTVFIVAVVVAVALIGAMAEVSIGGGAARAVYGGSLALFVGMYRQQRQMNIALFRAIEGIRDIIEPKEEA